MAETADYITRGQEILAEQPKIVVEFGIGLHPTILEGREHITDEELEGLVATLREMGIEGPLDGPVEILLKTETEGDSLYEEPEMRDVISSLVATTDTFTGYKEEMSPGHFVNVPVVVIDGPRELWTPPNQRLAKMALNHPWAAYEESQRSMPI